MSRALVLLSIIAFALPQIVHASCQGPKGDPVVLGATVSLTGSYEANGLNTYIGYELARERINALGGVEVDGDCRHLVIRYMNDESDPKLVQRYATRFVERDGIRFLLGPYSSQLTREVALVAELHGIPLVAAEAASTSLFSRGNRWIFGLLSLTDRYMTEFMKMVLSQSRTVSSQSRLAIAVRDDRFSLYVREAVLGEIAATDSNVTVVLDDRLPHFSAGPGLSGRSRQSMDVKVDGLLGRVSELEPDVLIFSGHSQGARSLARGLQTARFRPRLIGMTHCESGNVIAVASGAMDGVYCTSQWAPDGPFLDWSDKIFGNAEDFARTVVASFPDRYPDYRNVPYQVASAAAAVIVYADAFSRAATLEPEGVRDALADTDLKTFYGRVCFAPRPGCPYVSERSRLEQNLRGHNVGKPMLLRQIVDGQYQSMYRASVR